MEPERARELIAAERERLTDLLTFSVTARGEDRAAERDAGDGDADGAQPLEHEEVEIAIEESLREKLAALDRAHMRIENGTFGVSLESGAPIPDDRLEIDPAAELTLSEAAKHRHHDH